MISREEAKQRVSEYVSRRDLHREYVVIDEETITKDYGWLFFLLNRKYVETRNINDMELGLGPILFERQNQNIIQFGTALSGEQYLEEYEKQSSVNTLNEHK